MRTVAPCRSTRDSGQWTTRRVPKSPNYRVAPVASRPEPRTPLPAAVAMCGTQLAEQIVAHSAQRAAGFSARFTPRRHGIRTPRIVACMPGGIIRLLDACGIDPSGRHAVVVGRNPMLGKPVPMLLLGRAATVTYCHSKTEDLPAIAQSRHRDGSRPTSTTHPRPLAQCRLATLFDGGYTTTPQLGEFSVIQSVIDRTEPEPERQTPSAVAHHVPAEHIEELH